MTNRVISVGEGFWNIRAPLTVLGILPVGTHASLVRRPNGKYLLLDACSLDEPTKRWLDEQTNNGEKLEAVLHLHPFHTLFAKRLHEAYPNARQYGTERHHKKVDKVPWQPERTDTPALHALFADTLEFTVPRGVELIPADENLHFSSVLAFHAASKTLHVDDTLNYVRMPKVFSVITKDMLGFHPTLAKVLERRPGASKDFRAWAAELIERSRSIENLCAAHTSVLTPASGGAALSERITLALAKIEKKLARHEGKHG